MGEGGGEERERESSAGLLAICCLYVNLTKSIRVHLC